MFHVITDYSLSFTRVSPALTSLPPLSLSKHTHCLTSSHFSIVYIMIYLSFDIYDLIVSDISKHSSSDMCKYISFIMYLKVSYSLCYCTYRLILCVQITLVYHTPFLAIIYLAYNCTSANIPLS